MTYSEKEILIYHAVFELMKKGKDHHQLTTQEISNEAGIGKGTIYEYFKTKEEIFEKTILYYIEQEYEAILEVIEKGNDLEEIFYSLLKEGCSKERYSILQVMSKREVASKIWMEQAFHYFDGVMKAFLKKGRELQAIENSDDDLSEMALVAASSAFSFYHHITKSGLKNVDLNQYRRYAYQIFIKALK